MRKLPPKYESHVDNIIYIFVELISPYMSNISPNAITSMGVIFDIIGFYLCFINKFVFGILFFFIGYFFDCLDGYVARQYDKVTVFGDYYDHLSDLAKILGILFISYKLNSNLFLKLLPAFLMLFLFVIIHIDLQEIKYNKRKDSGTLSSLSNVAKYFHGNNIKNLSYSRFFGCGNAVVILLLLFSYIVLNRKFDVNGQKRK